MGYRRNSVIENTKAKTNNPSTLSSIIEARRLALSVDHAPCLVRVASSRLITSIRRIEAIKPTEQLIQYPQSLGRNRGVTERFPEHPTRAHHGRECRRQEQDGENTINPHLHFSQIHVKMRAEPVFSHGRGSYQPGPALSTKRPGDSARPLTHKHPSNSAGQTESSKTTRQAAFGAAMIVCDGLDISATVLCTLSLSSTRATSASDTILMHRRS